MAPKARPGFIREFWNQADLLNRLRYTQLAEEASRILPDPVDADQISTWWMQNGLSRDTLISRMCGSP